MLLAFAGGTAGFAYYYFIGCVSGSCPITSNPYISTAYGAIVGVILTLGKSEKKKTETSPQQQKLF
jgi:hypothetical protein